MPTFTWLSSSKLRQIVGADVRSLAALRIALALCVIADIISRARFATAFLTDAGIAPRSFVTQEFPPLGIHSLYFASGSETLPFLLLLIEAIFAINLLLGYRTKLATFVVWFLTLSVQLRNPLINQGGDILLRVMLFWALFLPLAECWSLDAKQRRSTKYRAGIAASFGTLGFGLQIAMLYLFAALIKYRAPEWSEGTAVYYALSIDQFVTEFGKSLLAYPAATAVAAKLVVAGEGLCVIGLYFPWKNWIFRGITLLLVVAMHIGFFLCFEVGPFPWFSSAAMLFFVPSEVWDRLGARPPVVVEESSNGPLHIVVQAVAAIYIVVIAQWNYVTLDAASTPAALTDILVSLPRVDQEWAMFAPAPQKLDGWIVIEGILASGAKTDLFKSLPDLRSVSQVTWDKPALISKTFPSERWRKYFMNLEFPENKAALAPLGRFLCRSWNGQHGDRDQLKALTIYFMREMTPPPGGAVKQEKLSLVDVVCEAA